MAKTHEKLWLLPPSHWGRGWPPSSSAHGLEGFRFYLAFCSEQTAALTPLQGSVSQCLPRSSHLHAEPGRLGLPLLTSWDLQLPTERGRWDLSSTSAQQSTARRVPRLSPALSATRDSPVLPKGFSCLLAVHPLEPLLCCHCDHSPRAHSWKQEGQLPK